jgi:CCR4-NOT transcription complex subunit 3
MSANRKLQTEIDRTLKKVEEGVEVFDEIWDKVYSATQQNQKEKYEVDLKKEIKKLQRHRDQIKTWVASSDIKDKRALTDARKLIETKMEQFKVCEKETKTKTYSKEGLARETKVDPHEAAKHATREWLSEKVDQLNLQIDMHEADLEKLTSGKGSKRHKAEIEVLEASIKRHRWHIARLELITRLLDNDALQHEQINEVKEDVEYYIDANQEPDFMDAYDETMDIFESLELGDLPDDDTAPVEARESRRKKKGSKCDDDEDDDADSKKKKKKDKQAEKEAEKAEKKAAKAAKAKAAATLPLTIGRATVSKVSPVPTPAPLSKKCADSTTKKSSLGVPTPQPLVAPVAPGAESLASILKQQSAAVQQAGGPVLAERLRSQQQAMPLATPGATFSAAAARSQQVKSLAARQRDPPPAPGAGFSGSAGSFGRPQPHAVPAGGTSMDGCSTQTQAAGPFGTTDATPEGLSLLARGRAPGAPLESTIGPASSARISASLACSTSSAACIAIDPCFAPGASLEPLLDVVTHESADDTYLRLLDARAQPLLPPHPPGTENVRAACSAAAARQLAALSLSNRRAPRKGDSERPRQYVPRNPYSTPPTFPTTPAPAFDDAKVFEKLGTDTLFFIFYYQQGTYQQFLAARELKKQSWRYHKKYMTWFQRHEEPKVTTDEFEQGTYVYFDYETGWCQRIKSDFTFEYTFLEDELAS